MDGITLYYCKSGERSVDGLPPISIELGNDLLFRMSSEDYFLYPSHSSMSVPSYAIFVLGTA